MRRVTVAFCIALLALALASCAQPETVRDSSGVLSAVFEGNADAHTIEVYVNGELITMQTEGQAWYGAGDIVKGDEIYIHYERRDGVLYAQKIERKPKAPERDSSSPSFTMVEKDTNYEIFKTVYHDRSLYVYYIFDNEDNIMDCGLGLSNPPDMGMENGFLKREQGCGTCCYLWQYYDTENGLCSDIFISPTAVGGRLIAYLDYRDHDLILIVQDIFDRNLYYCEFERDFQFKYDPCNIYAEFINNNKKLRITYWTGIDKHEVTETIDLF